MTTGFDLGRLVPKISCEVGARPFVRIGSRCKQCRQCQHQRRWQPGAGDAKSYSVDVPGWWWRGRCPWSHSTVCKRRLSQHAPSVSRGSRSSVIHLAVNASPMQQQQQPPSSSQPPGTPGGTTRFSITEGGNKRFPTMRLADRINDEAKVKADEATAAAAAARAREAADDADGTKRADRLVGEMAAQLLADEEKAQRDTRAATTLSRGECRSGSPRRFRVAAGAR